MARRAQMLALLPLASLVLLLAVQLTDTAPVTDASNIIPLDSDDGDEVFPAEHSDVTAGTDKHILGDQAATASSDSVGHTSAAALGENLDKHHDSVEKKLEDQVNTVDGNAAGSDENVKKHPDVTPTKTEQDEAASAMDSTAEDMDRPQDVTPTKTKQDEAASAMDSTAENMDEHQGAKPTKTEQDPSSVDGSFEVAGKTDSDHAHSSGEDAKMVEENEGHLAAENEEVKMSAEAVLKENIEKKIGEDLSDGESEENMDITDGSTAVTSAEHTTKKQPEEKHENSLTTVAVEGGDDEHSKEQIGTGVEGKDDESEDSVESASADEGSAEENSKETAEGTILKKEDIAEDEDENNKDTDDDALQNSSEETSDVEDVEVNGNHSTAYDVTSSPFAQLRAPSSDSHLTEKETHLGEDHENHRPSVEETEKKEPGSPDELIENDIVDSQVFKSDNKTASMGRSMPIAEDEEESENKDKTVASTEEKFSETAKESQHTEVKNAVEHENEEIAKHIIDNTSENKHETETKTDLDDSENESQLEDDDRYPEENLGHFSGKNDDEGSGPDEETLTIANVTETSSEEDGSGIAPAVGFMAHGAEMSAEHLDRKEEKESNKEDEMEVAAVHENEEDDDSGSGLEDGAGSGSHALNFKYTTENYMFTIPVVGDDDEIHHSETPGEADDKTESTDHHSKEENLTANKTDVHVMSVDSKEGDDHQEVYDGSGDDETTTPLPIITADSDEVLANVLKDIVDDNMALSNKDIDLVNSSAIGEARHAFQEEPVEKVISPQLAAAPASPSTEKTCEAGEDCEAGVSNDLDDHHFSPDVNSKTVSDDVKEPEAVTSTTPVVKEEESSKPPVTIDLNEPLLQSGEEVGSTAAIPEKHDVTEPIEDMDNLTMVDNGAPDTIVDHSFSETGVKQMSGKIREANVNELGISGQQNTDDLSEAEALDSSSASGSYVVLGCIMAVVVVLLAYAAIKSRRERGANAGSKKQNEVAGDDDDGTELKDMKLALLPPEDDCNGDIEANKKPLISKDEHQEEDEDKKPIIKQNGTLERSKPPRDVESQVDSSPAENQLKAASTPNAQGASPNKPQQRNGLSEVVVEKPNMTNGKTDSIITQPVSAKVKVIENEDSIAKTPVFINRGGTSPPR